MNAITDAARLRLSWRQPLRALNAWQRLAGRWPGPGGGNPSLLTAPAGEPGVPGLPGWTTRRAPWHRVCTIPPPMVEIILQHLFVQVPELSPPGCHPMQRSSANPPPHQCNLSRLTLNTKRGTKEVVAGADITYTCPPGELFCAGSRDMAQLNPWFVLLSSIIASIHARPDLSMSPKSI